MFLDSSSSLFILIITTQLLISTNYALISDLNYEKNVTVTNSNVTVTKNVTTSTNGSTIFGVRKEFKRGIIKCNSSSECQLLDQNSLCLMLLITPSEGKRCECAPGFINHPLTKSCVQLFECRTDLDCKFKSNSNLKNSKIAPNSNSNSAAVIFGSNPIIDEFECIEKSCRKKRMLKRFNELKTWLPLIITSSVLAVAAILFMICANRTFPSFRRRNRNWFNGASLSSSLKSSRAPSPPPPFEFPPSYSSCYPSNSNLTYHSVSSNNRIGIIYQPSPISVRSNLAPPPQYSSRVPSRNVSREGSRAPSPTPSLSASISLEPNSYGSVHE